eukprot:TRINITY_DN74660_c0_g1_i1.p1 TRINITY_DN74660_c0_g1~~TRINITY_DN74660_c0_g1_i1.p1  ORF type:complete len:531 (-),score=70.74 TRINITY_DN74660_c0_g1_i1:279-1871(-)
MAGPYADPSGVVRYEGIVISYSAAAGYGFIHCPQLSSSTGQEVFFQSSDCGGAPIANDSKVSLMVDDSNSSTGSAELDQIAGGRPRGLSIQLLASSADPPDSVRYTGIVTSFSLQSAWGFISCPELSQVFQKDVFFHVKDCGGALLSKGQTVTFLLASDSPPGKPQARSVQVPGNSVVVGVVPVKGQRYHGTVTSYAVASAWGFIVCPEIKAYFGKDVFFHHKDCNGQTIAKGALVSFELDVPSEGKPQARHILVEVGQSGDAFLTQYSQMSAAAGISQGAAVTNSSPHAAALSPSLQAMAASQLQSQLQDQIQAAMTMGLQNQLQEQLQAVADMQYQAESYESAYDPYNSSAVVPHSQPVPVAAGTSMQGTIQSFSPQAGWGFVECPALQLPAGKGVFFHVKDAAAFGTTIPSRGVPVTFTVGHGPSGKMQGKHVTPIGPVPAGGAQVSSSTVVSQQHQQQLLAAMAAHSVQATDHYSQRPSASIDDMRRTETGENSSQRPSVSSDDTKRILEVLGALSMEQQAKRQRT